MTYGKKVQAAWHHERKVTKENGEQGCQLNREGNTYTGSWK